MTREMAIALLKFIKTFEDVWLGRDATGIALDMAIAALREQESAENAHCNSCKKCNSWISVEEKLPEDWVWVQVYRSANKTMDTDFCTPSRKGGWCHYNDITHWMPLPEPPEVEV